MFIDNETCADYIHLKYVFFPTLMDYNLIRISTKILNI